MANFAVNPLNSGTNNFLNPITALTQLATDLVNPGVVGATTNTSGAAPTTGAGGVNAQGSPNMSVQVSSGHYWVNATPSGGTAQTFGVTQDVSQTVTINANSSGSTAYDFVYLQLDPTQLNNPAATGLGVGSIITSRSTTAYSATAANNGNSNGAIANSILLGVVTVANGAASITNSNITDARQGVSLNVLTGAPITLGYAQSTTSFSTASTSSVQVPGLSITVVVQAGRRIKITVFSNSVDQTGGFGNSDITLYDGAVGGTALQQAQFYTGANNTQSALTLVWSGIPTAGTHTYNVGLSAGANTANMNASSTSPMFILVEAI